MRPACLSAALAFVCALAPVAATAAAIAPHADRTADGTLAVFGDSPAATSADPASEAGAVRASATPVNAAAPLPAGALGPHADRTRDGRVVPFEAHSCLADPIAAGLRFALAGAEGEGAALAAAYAARDYAPIWFSGGRLNERAAAVSVRLSRAAEDGLDPDDYPVPDVSSAATGAERLAAELTLSRTVIRYAHDAQAGRVAPRTISRIITAEPPAPDPAAALASVAGAADPVAALEAFHPQHAGYQALRAALKALLAAPGERQKPIASGPMLRLGDVDPRVALVRRRIGAFARRGSDPTVFDEPLEAAVRTFQRENGLAADGIVGPRTLAALNRGLSEDPVKQLVVNLERWRWLPRTLGEAHVLVNVPAYIVHVHRSGEIVWSGRVIVGSTKHPTPLFSDRIEYVVVNPYWNVPYSIARNEMLGNLQVDPARWLRRHNYEVVHGGRVVDPDAMIWDASTLRQVRIRQRPGRGNALGRVKFLFPNRHSVYLHDTPSRRLFERDRRALSHGCIRVQNPFEFADVLLAAETEVTGLRLRRMVGGDERWLKLEHPVPVHLAYFTMAADADGTLRTYPDIYGYDRRLARALGL